MENTEGSECLECSATEKSIGGWSLEKVPRRRVPGRLGP